MAERFSVKDGAAVLKWRELLVIPRVSDRAMRPLSEALGELVCRVSQLYCLTLVVAADGEPEVAVQILDATEDVIRRCP